MNVHAHPSDWGVRPVLFHLAGFPIPAYGFFVALGLLAGALVFFLQTRRDRSRNSGEHTFYILIAALVGGALGSKLPYFIMNWRRILDQWPDLAPLLSGRTIVGGLLGGAMGVYLIKRRLGISGHRGDLFVPAIAIGVAIGRLGCFFRGCCYGIPTALPWGVNFGDSIPRHPAQLYESLFMLILLGVLCAAKPGRGIPGRLFRVFLISYFIFRFIAEFIRVEPVIFLGFTAFQLVSVAVALYYFIQLSKPPFGGKNSYGYGSA